MKRSKIVLIFCLILTLNVPLVFGAWIVKDIQEPESDQFRVESGNVFDGVDTLVLKDPNTQVRVALRFRGLNIDRNTRINGANLSFVSLTSAYPFEANSSVTIYGIDVDDLRPFDVVEPWDLPVTDQFVIWNTSLVNEGNVRYNVSVENIIQEIVSRYGYTSASKMGFMIYSLTGEQRVVYASEFTPYRGPRLYIRHGETPPAPPGLPPDAEYNSTIGEYDIYRIPGFGQVTSFTSAMIWDADMAVYPFQGKTAYVNVTDKFYVFGVKVNVIGYHFRSRANLTWSAFIPLYEHLPGSEIYTDFTVDRFGKLHVGWVWTWDNDVYYMKFDLNADGSATNYTGRQTVEQDTRYPPVVIAVDSEGYPYIAYNAKSGVTYGGRIAWSVLNNGTWQNNPLSPESVETNLGVNPPNDYWFAHELVAMGDRRMNLIVNSRHSANNFIYTCSKRNQNSGNVWTGEGEFMAGDKQNPMDKINAISGASGMDISDPADGRAIRNDDTRNDLWLYNLGNWARTTDTFQGANNDNYTVMIADEQTGLYVTIGYRGGQSETFYTIIYQNGTWTNQLLLRTFEINLNNWDLVAHQNPQYSTILNKTIISYAWRKDATLTFYHDWFYLEDGPNPTITDETWEAWKNGTKTYDCETLECLEKLIEDDDPDPDDPEPGYWSSIGGLDRFRMKLIIFVSGLILLMGSLLFGLAFKPSASTWIGIFFSMIVGWALLVATQSM